MKNFIVLSLIVLSNVGFSFSPLSWEDPITGKVHGMGLIRTEDSLDFMDTVARVDLKSVTAVPGKYDLTPRVSPPEDQGSCGSCWDFSLTKALRSALMLAGKDPGTLAFNYLLNNCGPVREYGCNGGDFDAGKNFLNKLGPWLESQDPYKGYETSCKKGLPVAGTAIEYVKVGNEKPSFQELAAAVSQDHVLSIDVAVCGAWGSYSGGIFSRNDCGAGSINHMINMVGYDCETSVDSSGNCVFDSSGKPKNGDGFLIVMNNWGTSWGEKGYMRTRWGIDAIAYDAFYFTVNVVPPKPVTFIVESADVKLTATVQPQATYTVDQAKTALTNALDSLGD